MQVTWQKFHEDGQTVEVQFYAPDGPSSKLILMCSGFPGMGGTRFEQRHAAALCEFKKHTVGIIKHAGTRLDVPDAPYMVNNAARLMEGRQKGETHLGGGPSTVAHWLREPWIVLNQLRDAFAHFDIIGNSFGAISAFWSLIQPGAPLAKVKNLLCLAGGQGVDSDPVNGIMRIWNPLFLSNPAIWDKVTLDTPLSICATLKAAYADIADKAADLPAHIAIKYMVVTADELLKVSDTEHFRDRVMKGRGELILNTTDRAYPAHGLLAHDTPDLPPEKLMELLHDH